MLSDEERKVIEELKNKKADYFMISNLTGKILLNLIEKQSKEIEEINKENLEIRDWKYVIDSPIDLDKLKELDLIKIKGKEYVSKDKIKAKIEELDYNDIGNFERRCKKEVLQSLLEKE